METLATTISFRPRTHSRDFPTFSRCRHRSTMATTDFSFRPRNHRPASPKSNQFRTKLTLKLNKRQTQRQRLQSGQLTRKPFRLLSFRFLSPSSQSLSSLASSPSLFSADRFVDRSDGSSRRAKSTRPKNRTKVFT